jgi:hypothetical protein
VGHDLFVEGLLQAGRVQMMAEPFFGLLQRDRLAQRSGDGAELHILAGLQAVDHLGDELQPGFRKVGRKYPQKFLQLFSQSQRDLGTMHEVAS